MTPEDELVLLKLKVEHRDAHIQRLNLIIDQWEALWKSHSEQCQSLMEFTRERKRLTD